VSTLKPLTKENLLAHTHITNPENMPSTTTSEVPSTRSVPKSDNDRLSAYGVVILRKDQEFSQFSRTIDKFVEDVVEREDPTNTPSAKNLHKFQKTAANALESEATSLISQWLMFPDRRNNPNGEKYIYLSNEVRLGTEYVKHQNSDFSLPEPRPDKVNGYVAHLKQTFELDSKVHQGGRHHYQNSMGPILHEDAFFAWLTAQYKSAIGQTLQYTE
jgi:hypothetical protein